MIYLVIIGGVVLFAVLLNKAQGLTAEGEAKQPEPKVFEQCAVVEGDGVYEHEVVGESYYQEAINEICGGKTPDGHQFETMALLFPDDENPHDPKAVCVQINKRTVGYLSRENARELRAQFPQGGIYWKVKAIIVGGWNRGDGDEGYYGVKLDF